jgi:hypothetical protein
MPPALTQQTEQAANESVAGQHDVTTAALACDVCSVLASTIRSK